MNISDIQCFKLGAEMNLELFIFVLPGTYTGAVEDCGASLNNGLGHDALDGDFCVDENDGTVISYRVPDLSGTPGSFLLGENTFKLENGMCFVLTSEYEAEQLPYTTKDDALAHLAQR